MRVQMSEIRGPIFVLHAKPYLGKQESKGYSIKLLHRLRNSFLCPLLFALCTVLCTAQQSFGELFAGRVYTQPRRIYVNQSFDIILEIEVSRGQDIDNIRIQGLPNNPDFISLGTLKQERVRKTRRRKDGEVVDVLRFQAGARCHKSVSHQFSPILSCDLVKRRSRGFFSFSSSSEGRLRLSPFTLNIRNLPEKGRPEAFSGAVGQFKIKGTLSKTAARPGDILTLSLELRGTGSLDDAPAPAPGEALAFKSYPPKEVAREKNLIRTEQIFIPQSTNAVAIPPAEFSYFNPETERYEVCSSPSFKINFITTEATAQTNSINVIASSTPSTVSPAKDTITSRDVNTLFHKMLPVFLACLTLLTASFIFLTVIKFNKWTAVGVTLLTVSLGAYSSYRASGYEPVREISLVRSTEVYLAPSLNAPSLMKLSETAEVIPLESTEYWTRIEVEKQRGWIENSALPQ